MSLRTEPLGSIPEPSPEVVGAFGVQQQGGWAGRVGQRRRPEPETAPPLARGGLAYNHVLIIIPARCTHGALPAPIRGHGTVRTARCVRYGGLAGGWQPLAALAEPLYHLLPQLFAHSGRTIAVITFAAAAPRRPPRL